jgi:hypothetical protein
MMKSVVSLFPKPQEDPQNVFSALSIRGFSLSRETNEQKIDATKRTHKCDVDEASAPFRLLKLRNK